MRIAYLNALEDYSRGGNTHVRQFIENATALGHEVWAGPTNRHPAARRMPAGLPGRVQVMQRMDVAYVRLTGSPAGHCRWATGLRRRLYGSPVMVWEFNTVPEFVSLSGGSQGDVELAIEWFRTYGRGCDLAVCVSRELVRYVQDRLGIKCTLCVPNGSDPDLFRPDVLPVARLKPFSGHLNVAWIGSADIPWTDFDLLRQAAELLSAQERGGQVSFHIIGAAGPGLMRDMPPNVYYWGIECYEMMPRWLAAMDVGLCLYRSGPAYYGSPVKLFEYMSSGLAVVSTFHPQIRKVLDELGQADLLVPDDAEALANVLAGLAQDREGVRERGEAARQRVIECYNWRRAVQDTLDEIETLMKERRSGVGGP